MALLLFVVLMIIFASGFVYIWVRHYVKLSLESQILISNLFAAAFLALHTVSVNLYVEDLKDVAISFLLPIFLIVYAHVTSSRRAALIKVRASFYMVLVIAILAFTLILFKALLLL